jgi:hypothetical protein
MVAIVPHRGRAGDILRRTAHLDHDRGRRRKLAMRYASRGAAGPRHQNDRNRKRLHGAGRAVIRIRARIAATSYSSANPACSLYTFYAGFAKRLVFEYPAA